MASVIKLKRSETASAVPTTSHLEVGEVALNTADKQIYVRDSSNNIVVVANYSTGITQEDLDRLTALEAATATLVFPTGDYGTLTALTQDAFGQAISASFDCLTTPAGAIGEEDLGVLT